MQTILNSIARWAVLFLVLGLVCAPLQLRAAPGSEIVVDAQSGRILYSSNMNSLRHPASLTKIMTLYMVFLALEQGKIKLNTLIPVSEYASTRIPSKLGLQPGDRIRLRDAVYGIITQSANDAATAVAEYIGGNEDRFAAMMTAQARSMGMKRTTYRNASGLHDDEQVTTAFDQAILARALMYNFPQQYALFRTRAFTFDGITHKNHNRLMSRYAGMDGIKTGFIRQSGFNLVASAKRGGRRLIGVVFGGQTARSRDTRMAVLLDAGFERLYAEGSRGAQYASAPVIRDTEDNADVSSDASYHIAQTEKALAQNDVAEGDEDTTNTANATPIIPNKNARKKTASTTAWGVQLGAYGSRKQSLSVIATAKKRVPSHLKTAKPNVVSARNGRKVIYRARLTGLSEKAARAACNTLSNAGHICTTLPPRG